MATELRICKDCDVKFTAFEKSGDLRCNACKDALAFKQWVNTGSVPAEYIERVLGHGTSIIVGELPKVRIAPKEDL